MKNFFTYLFLTAVFFSFQLRAQTPLTVYTEENLQGSSQSYPIFNTYTNLGAFDNAIKSFTLQQGYMATFATNSDGTGYSRVFRADDDNLAIPVLATESVYLDETISYIRVMALHDYVTKKGWAGWILDEVDAINASWRYDWSAGGATSSTVEYVPIKQNLGWPSFGEIEGKPNVTHVLGYNEPDRPDQANIPNDVVIDNWKYYMKSGLRVGSPAHSDPYNGLWGFMAEAEANNLRVDFIAIHSYWSVNQQDWSWRLDNVWNAFQRPIWITEWNNGANWTTEAWPNGNRLATDANVQKQLTDITNIINILESKPYVERYSFYNAVEDCRSAVLIINDCWKANNPNWANYQWLQTALQDQNNEVISTWSDGCGVNTKVLTPVGVYLRDRVSAKAFNPSTEYIPTWKPYKENLSYKISEDFQNVILQWEGLNGELVNNYIVERRLSGETSWSPFYDSSDYNVLTASDALPNYALYHLKTVGKDNSETTSAQIAVSAKSMLGAVPVSAKKIDLSWSNVENAVSYNIKRATTSGGTYELIAANVVGTSYQDTNLDPNTTYYYKLWPVNAGSVESGFSSPEAMATTFALVEPSGAVQNILVGSGDDQVKLKWDFKLDSQFDIKRSESQSGPFTSIGTTGFETTQYTDLSAANGTTYYYTISAFNDMGTTPDSDVVTSNPNAGQHLYYDFNGVFGASPYDQWGVYNGTLFPSVGSAAGKGGGGINLTGTDDSYMQIENGVVKDLTDFTIATWVKLKTSTNWVRIFDFGTGSATNMFLTPQNGNNGTYRFAIKKNNGAEQQINSSTNPVLNTWTHIAITMSGTVGIMYINGIEVGRKENFTLNPFSLGITTQNYIGKSQYPDPLLDGAIDEFRIYNRALDASEITSLFGEDISVPGECPFTPLYTDKTNLTPDPEMDAFNSYQGWGAGNQVLETADTYCGPNAMRLNGKCGTSLDLPVNWVPNSTYRVRFAAKTVGGTAKVGFSGTDGAAAFVFDNPTWDIVDYTFNTGANAGTGLIFINSCESETATAILIDNYELYRVADVVANENNEDCGFVHLYSGEQNLAPNRACDDLSAYQGWANNGGIRQVVTDNIDAHCGDYIKVTTLGGCNAALDINPVDWAPNATYRLHVYVKTIGGSIGFIANNVDPTVVETFDTGGEWQLIDYSFSTGSSPSASWLSFNGCDGGPTATEVWIDDFELYRTDTILGVDDNFAPVLTDLRAIGNRVYVSNVTSTTEVNIYSITGALVKTLKTNIDTDFEFNTGLWIATIKTAEGQKTQKLLVR
ncbi:LamG-like jellyroll fold domain-containing protein [Flavobacteriaceae bacterium SZ-1-7]|uniref:LamG-like jellyroll fold domain-containing protein n=1 Tax=Tamlana sedimenti TaxID=3134126 RepID=UPI0031224C5F